MTGYYPLVQEKPLEGLSFSERKKFRAGYRMTEMEVLVASTLLIIDINNQRLKTVDKENVKKYAGKLFESFKATKTKTATTSRLPYILGLINGSVGNEHPKEFTKIMHHHEYVFLLKHCELTEQQLFNLVTKPKNESKFYPPYNLPTIGARTDLTPKVINRIIEFGNPETLGQLMVNPTVPDETKTMIALLGTPILPNTETLHEEHSPISSYSQLKQIWDNLVEDQQKLLTHSGDFND